VRKGKNCGFVYDYIEVRRKSFEIFFRMNSRSAKRKPQQNGLRQTFTSCTAISDQAFECYFTKIHTHTFKLPF
jgi:hypothetical protein